MQTVTYRSLLEKAAEFSGLDPDELQVSEASSLRRFLATSLKRIWESNRWSDLTLTEQRGYRAAWSASTAYAAGNEVYWPATDSYFQALRASTNQAPADAGNETNFDYWYPCQRTYGGSDYSATQSYLPGDMVFYPTTRTSYACHTACSGTAPTNTAAWGELTPFEQSIDFDQTGETPIGEVFRVSLDNPAIVPGSETYDFYIVDALMVPFGCARPWVEFRKRCPDLTGDTFDATAIYTPGEQMEWTDGYLYDCLATTTAGQTPVSAPAKWRLVDIPEKFSAYCAHSAAAMWFKREEKWDAFRAEYGFAKDEFVGEVDKLVLQQNQHRPMRVDVR